MGPLSDRDTTSQAAAAATHCFPAHSKLRPFCGYPLTRTSRTIRSFWPFGKNGQHWTRFTNDDGNGKRCLIGAVDYIERTHRSFGAGMTEYLSAAIWPGGNRCWMITRVARFNDTCKGFERIRAVIRKARALAQRDAERLPEIIAATDVA